MTNGRQPLWAKIRGSDRDPKLNHDMKNPKRFKKIKYEECVLLTLLLWFTRLVQTGHAHPRKKRSMDRSIIWLTSRLLPVSSLFLCPRKSQSIISATALKSVVDSLLVQEYLLASFCLPILVYEVHGKDEDNNHYKRHRPAR